MNNQSRLDEYQRVKRVLHVLKDRHRNPPKPARLVRVGMRDGQIVYARAGQRGRSRSAAPGARDRGEGWGYLRKILKIFTR